MVLRRLLFQEFGKIRSPGSDLESFPQGRISYAKARLSAVALAGIAHGDIYHSAARGESRYLHERLRLNPDDDLQTDAGRVLLR
jgi:hypothetical protein